ncbi:MAG: hypothetical protein GEU88_07545 [Solirubrobacterales bacterium]|nr:hypothetical protein [Solirubrobacterales bacterium]
MWGVVLVLFAAFVSGFLAGGGPALWFALLIGLAVLGGDPGDPLGALVATVAALAAAELARAQISARLRR